MATRITLDFNCIISLENEDIFSGDLKKLVSLHEQSLIDISIPAISASENSMDGDSTENIHQFITRIDKLSKRKFDILKPICILGMSYYDFCIWSDEVMIKLDHDIHKILFPNISVNYADYAKNQNLDPNVLTPIWRNKKCDVISLWCHIYYKHDIFVTNDRNFHKETKKASLAKLGVKKILTPNGTLSVLGN